MSINTIKMPLACIIILSSVVGFASETCEQKKLVESVTESKWGPFKQLGPGETNPEIKYLILKAVKGESRKIMVDPEGQVGNSFCTFIEFIPEACKSLYVCSSGVHDRSITLFDHSNGESIELSAQNGVKLSEDRKWMLISNCHTSSEGEDESCTNKPLLQYFHLEKGRALPSGKIEAQEIFSQLTEKSKNGSKWKNLPGVVRIFPEVKIKNIFEVTFRATYNDSDHDSVIDDSKLVKNRSEIGPLTLKFCPKGNVVTLCK